MCNNCCTPFSLVSGSINNILGFDNLKKMEKAFREDLISSSVINEVHYLIRSLIAIYISVSLNNYHIFCLFLYYVIGIFSCWFIEVL